MAMGRRKAKQQELFVATTQLARSPGHPFYEKLNKLLAEAGFDAWLEGRCEPCYKHENPHGRKSIPSGVYFRMILIGYFEGIESESGIAWRCRDSFLLRNFLGIGPTEESPDRTSLGKTKRRLPLELFEEVFQFVLKMVLEKKPNDFTLEALRAVELNRDRMSRAKGKHLGRLRSEKVERSFAYVCDTGGGRRCWSRGLLNATKNYLLRVAAHNLGRMMLKLFGLGKPRIIFSFCDLIHTLQLAWLVILRVVQLPIAYQHSGS